MLSQAEIKTFVDKELEWIGVMEHPVITKTDVFTVCVRILQKEHRQKNDFSDEIAFNILQGLRNANALSIPGDRIDLFVPGVSKIIREAKDHRNFDEVITEF